MFKDLDKLYAASLDDPSVVAKTDPELGSFYIPNIIVSRFLKDLSEVSVKVYLALVMLTGAGDAFGRGSVINTVAGFLNMTREQVTTGIDELERTGLATKAKRFLRDTREPSNWRWKRDDEYRMETTPAILVETDSQRLAAMLAGASASADGAKPGAGEDKAENDAIEYQALINENIRTAHEILVSIGPKVMQQCELWLAKYGYGPDMVRAILKYCVSKGKSDIAYAASVAREWHKAGLKSPEEVDIYLTQYEELKGRYSRIRKQLARYDGLTQAEKDLYDRWTGDWGFPEELVLFACKTMTKANKPSFDYLNKVLESWKQAGVKSVDDAQELMDKHEAAKQFGNTGRRGRTARPTYGAAVSSGQNASSSGTAPRRAEEAKYYADFVKLEMEMQEANAEKD